MDCLNCNTELVKSSEDINLEQHEDADAVKVMFYHCPNCNSYMEFYVK